MTTDDSASGGPATQSPEPASKAVRRRASRAAGPAAALADASADDAPASVRVEAPGAVRVRSARPVLAPPRRRPHRVLVAALGLGITTVAVAVLGILTAVLVNAQGESNAGVARDQRFVDTATQTVVNMFSYDQNTIDDSVNRFVSGTSGPLRDMLSQGQNVENLKSIFRDTNASSETVISGAALEKVDETAKNASVIVSARVTVTDLDGVNKPSQPYRLRIIVHEDDQGNMSGYDLKYPDGGN